MRILITGGNGFIGSNLIEHWLKTYPDDIVLNLDCASYAGKESNTDSFREHPNYRSSPVDLRDRQDVRELVARFDPEGCIHLAAETHVDNSIRNPGVFFETNVMGTLNLIEELRLWWSLHDVLGKSRFLHVSTDEVYGSLTFSDPPFTEKNPYDPSSPYSASKAGSDHLVRSYHRTYGMNVLVTNCSNNYGPRQHEEKFIPTVIRKAAKLEPIPIYGSGRNVRDWIHVQDHCKALDLLFHGGSTGETYCLGDGSEVSNIVMANTICELMDELVDSEYPLFKSHIKRNSLLTFVNDRPGHDFRYGIDNSKFSRFLECNGETYAATDLSDGLKSTVRWYLDQMIKGLARA